MLFTSIVFFVDPSLLLLETLSKSAHMGQITGSFYGNLSDCEREGWFLRDKASVEHMQSIFVRHKNVAF